MRFFARVLTGGALYAAAQVVPQPPTQPAHLVPPPVPQVGMRKSSPGEFSPPPLTAGPSSYSIGDPSDEEQLYLELINRARSNPALEGQRLRAMTDPEVLSAYVYFGLDLDLMVSQFSSINPAPPLSMNAALLTAARLHSQDMYASGFQGHIGSNGSDPASRISAQGFPWQTFGENVYAAARSVLYGHAGFQVDWGYGPGGMQNPPGHRQSIHSPAFREAGIGLVMGVNGSVGPQLVTQDFATRFGSTPFVTGVSYYDHNGNGFYDLGEGLGGVTVTVSGSGFYAVTANAGGYSVPVPGNGTYPVTFTAPGLPTATRTVVVSANNNAKLDHTPAYSPPRISGPSIATVGQATAYAFTPVGAALAYQWKQGKRIPLTHVEGAENGLGNVLVATSPGYTVLSSDARAAGTYSFHLAHTQPTDQVLTLSRLIRPSANSALRFAGRLGWATAGQVARAQISTNGGLGWQDVWALAGVGHGGQTAFVRYTNSLARFAGQEIQVRFVYDYVGGSYYNQSSSGVGLYLDEIHISAAEEVVDTAQRDISSGTTFSCVLAEAADYSLRVRAKVADRWLDWGPPLLVRGASSGLGVRFKGPPLFTGSRTWLTFDVVNGSASHLQIELSPSPAGPWTLDPSAIFQTVGPGARFLVSASPGNSRACFYRVVAR